MTNLNSAPAHGRTSAALVAVAIALGGCASTKADLFGDTEALPDMLEVYEQHMAGSAQGRARAPSGSQASSLPSAMTAAQLVSHTRDASNEIALQFTPLPNPTLLMYVDPHLTAGGLPVPGYTTAFTLFERTEYALPGEVPLAPIAPWQPLPANPPAGGQALASGADRTLLDARFRP